MSEHFKFELDVKSGRRQSFFSEDDDYHLYRKHMFDFAKNICDFLKDNKSLRVLEVGASSKLYVEKTFPELDTSIIEKTCVENGIYYKTLDIDDSSNADYIGSVEDMSFINEKFDVIILIGILEHVTGVFKTPEQLHKVSNENAVLFVNTPYMFKIHGPMPDCWRFSEYGYRVLFDKLFEIEDIDTFPPNELGKNSIALSLNVTLRKTNHLA